MSGRSSRRTRFVWILIAVAGLMSASSPTHAVSQAGRLLDQGPSEFTSPWGIATDEFGDIYVADAYKNRIVKFDAGTKQAEWVAGAYGSGDGQLYLPQGLAVGDGVIYVADTLNHRIAMFTQEGAWAGSIVGAGENTFAYPADVDYLNGYLFVAEGGGHCRVTIIRKSGATYNMVGTVGSCGGAPGQLSSPAGVAATDTEIFIADAQGAVKKFDYFGNYLLTIASPGYEEGQVDGPYALAVSKTGAEGTHVWVIEAGSTSRAQRFTSDGTLVDVLTGTNTNHFSYPHGIALSPTADVLYVADTSGDDPNVYSFLVTEPEISVVADDNLKHLVKTEGLWFRVAYNQTTKTCKVVATADVSVPGHPEFTVDRDFRVGSLADDYKVDVSAKQAKWMARAKESNKKVSVRASFRGKCDNNVKVTAKENYKAS